MHDKNDSSLTDLETHIPTIWSEFEHFKSEFLKEYPEQSSRGMECIELDYDVWGAQR